VTALLSLRQLRKEYRAGVPVLHPLDLDFDAGEGGGLTAVIGPSGTGKSTLLRCINRLVDPTGGQTLFEGEDLATLRGPALRRMRCRIGVVFQEYNLVERLTVIENVLCGRLGVLPLWRPLMRRFPAQDIERAFELLEAVGLGEDYASRRCDALSGGQRQRVGIARALMQRPRLILADEPTSSLDPKTAVEIMELLHGVSARERVPVIVNIHNVELARRYASRIVGLSQGRVVFDGPPHALGDALLDTIYGGEGWQG